MCTLYNKYVHNIIFYKLICCQYSTCIIFLSDVNNILSELLLSLKNDFIKYNKLYTILLLRYNNNKKNIYEKCTYL